MVQAMVPGVDPVALLDQAPEGIAVVDATGHFLAVNSTGAVLCGLAADELVARPSPFLPAVDDAAAERVAIWTPRAEVRREFAYRTQELAGSPGAAPSVVVFRDVTEDRRHQRRIGAIAAAASRVAARRSLDSTLEALVDEVLGADELVAVQLLTVDATGDRFQVMGTGGFDCPPDFFDLLLECQGAGAELVTTEAFTTLAPVVVPSRYERVMTEPAWEPLREYQREPRWDWFASVPMMVRGAPIGVLNAYFAPGEEVDQTTLDFLMAMAAQAAQALDYAALLERERTVATQEERQRLARDLHDSVVQSVFSMSMQVESLSMRAGRVAGTEPGIDAEYVGEVAQELGQLSRSVLRDLRAMVTDLHPAPMVEDGLADALDTLVQRTRRSSGLDVRLELADPDHELSHLPAELGEDASRIIAEAVHNSVKHAGGSRVEVHVRVQREGRRRWLAATVFDDGCGLSQPVTHGEGSGGFGMTAMSERAERWGGELSVDSGPGSGTAIRLRLPLPVTIPTRRESR